MTNYNNICAAVPNDEFFSYINDLQMKLSRVKRN